MMIMEIIPLFLSKKMNKNNFKTENNMSSEIGSFFEYFSIKFNDAIELDFERVKSNWIKSTEDRHNTKKSVAWYFFYIFRKPYRSKVSNFIIFYR